VSPGNLSGHSLLAVSDISNFVTAISCVLVKSVVSAWKADYAFRLRSLSYGGQVGSNPLQALLFFEAGAVHDFLPHWNFADHARMQVFGAFIFHHKAGVEHFGLDVGLLQDDLSFFG
jgi:hypothetical protein